MKILSGIYKITNKINNKVYIGKSCDIYTRWYAHKSAALHPNWKKYNNSALYKAIREDGNENFSYEIIELVPVEQLDERERYWINYYNSYNNGYNLTLGGDGYNLHDHNKIAELWEEGLTIKQISEIISCSLSAVGIVLSANGITTEEKLERSKEDAKNSYMPYAKKIIKRDPITFEIVEEFPSLAQAAASLGVCRATFREGLSTNHNFYKNYFWEVQAPNKFRDMTARAVAQIDLNTNEIIKTFPSLSAAAKEINGCVSTLSRVCRGILKTSKGFGWKFIDKEI